MKTDYEWDRIEVYDEATGQSCGWWVVPKDVRPPCPYWVMHREPYERPDRVNIPKVRSN